MIRRFHRKIAKEDLALGNDQFEACGRLWTEINADEIPLKSTNKSIEQAINEKADIGHKHSLSELIIDTDKSWENYSIYNINKIKAYDKIYDGWTAETENELRDLVNDSEPKTIKIQDNIILTQDLTIPNYITLEFVYPYTLGGNVTLTINGRIKADNYRIFEDDLIITGNMLNDEIYPEWFGATGDGITDDTMSFQKVSNLINSKKGGIIKLTSNKVYRVGKQIFAGSTELGYAYKNEPIFLFENCTKPVVLDLNGATIKVNDGLKFGSFDPSTGEPYYPDTLPFTDYNYRADAYNIISSINCSLLIVKNGEIDGNIDGIILGGQWGDKGYQCAGTGIYSQNTKKIIIENIHVHHCALDGIMIRHEDLIEASPATPIYLKNVYSEYNARQGLTLTGGIGITVVNCSFSKSGRHRFSTAPSSGIDLEEEQNSVIRNGIFINCIIEDNTGSGLVADSGDVADMVFINCKFIGTTTWSAWIDKPRFSFFKCIFVGAVTGFGFPTPGDSVKFYSCLFTDEEVYSETGKVYRHYLFNNDSAQGVSFEDCIFTAEQTKLAWISGSSDNLSTLKNCVFILRAGEDYIANRDFCLLLRNCHIENVIIKDEIVNPPADAYYISANNCKYTGITKTTSDKIKWFNWSWGVGNEPIPIHTPPFPVLTLTTNQSLTNGRHKIIYSNSLPDNGKWEQGDIVFNTSPTVDASNMILVGWICIQSGDFAITGGEPVFKPMYVSTIQ